MSNVYYYLKTSIKELITEKYLLYVNLCSFITSSLAKWVLKITYNGFSFQLMVLKAHLTNVLFFFKKHTSFLFTQLLDITVVDFFYKPQHRFHVIYQCSSLLYNARYSITVPLEESDLMPTITHLFQSAGWFECEIWDLFGIYFIGHIQIHRLLTDYGFRSFPLRKDFPLSGYSELYYNNSKRRVGYYKVSIAQEFRNYLFLHPWREEKLIK